jgi:myo-inositol-1(or 4)-monophosphatase
LPVSEFASDRDRLAAAVQQAGAVAKSFFGGQFKQWNKVGDSPVTEADIAANDILHKLLMAPGDGWLSEESENDPTRLQARRVWVIDPIDGTRAFIAGREDWSVSAALVVEGRPVAAALYAPVTDELFLATAGQGAIRNGAPIRATAGSELNGARVGGPKRMMERVVERGTGLVVLPRIHSLALRLARVADGTLDAAVAGGNGHDWDLAAADLLVHEAGGLMSGLDGRALTYNRPDPVHSVLIAAGRERHEALVNVIRAQTSEPV